MARLSEADAVRLAARFGRATQDFAGIVGLTPDEAAAKLALDPAALGDALAENSERSPVGESSGAEKPRKAAAKKTAKRTPKKAKA